MSTKTAAKPAKTAAKKAATRVARSPQATQAKAETTPETAMYEVLEPFKFHGTIVKPPCLIECTAAEAQVYQDAGVLGTEPGEVPSAEAADSAD